jgi:hypothetical protein
MLLEVEDFLTSELVLFLGERHVWVEPNEILLFTRTEVETVP